MDSTTIQTEVIADVSADSTFDSCTSSVDEVPVKEVIVKKVEVVVDYEREEGDGQEYESVEEEEEEEEDGGELRSSDEEDSEGGAPNKEKKLDDDEDRRNPQYIPKRGTFYEHDDRTAEDESTPQSKETDAERDLEQSTAKKVWKEHENRWGHDMYNEDDQKPKSAEELIELYGYDIRNEEGPPRARRRRRYGRGPNKYTRNWEDEGAYNRPSAPGSVQGDRRGEGGRGARRGGGGGEDQQGSKRNSQTFYSNKVAGRGSSTADKEAFPALPGADTTSSPSQQPPARDNAAWNRKDTNQNANNREDYPKMSTNNNRPLQLTPPPPEDEPPVSKPPAKQAVHEHEFRRGSGRGTVSRRGKPFESAMPVNSRGPGRDAGNRGRFPQLPRSADEGGKGDATYYKKCQDNHSPKLKTQDDLANDLQRLNIYAKQQHEVQQVQPGREYGRQRPDNNKNNVNYSNSHQQQHHPHPVQGMNVEHRQTVVPPRLQQQDAAANRPKRYSSLRQRSLPESGAPQSYAQPPQQHQYYQTGYVQQPLPPQPSTIQLIHPPTTYAASFPSPPTFIQPAPPMMRRPPSPGHYIGPAPPAQVLNFVPQPHPSQVYPAYQGFTAVQAPPPQAPDMGMYQPQGGITYYSPEEQMMSRALTQRRQRAAIPIVPPPDVYGRGRGRISDLEGYEGQEYRGAGDQYSPSSDEVYQEEREEEGEEETHYVREGEEKIVRSRPSSRAGKYDDAEAVVYEGQAAN